MLRVFVSSTWLDMEAERGAVEDVLQRLKAARFVGMEHFGSRPGTPADESLAEVARCELYLGVIGHRYGSGITEQEYRHAAARGLPCIVYLKRGWQPDGSDEARRLAALRDELMSRHTCAQYDGPQDLAMRVAADLHNHLFDRLLLQGVRALGSSFEARVRGFVGEYLGDAERPVAFGGRDAELAALDAWLDGAGQPPYLLLGAPAGRGKSALLVRWARSLAARADVAPVFFPVSVRFRTHLAALTFAAISAQLAALFDEPVPAGPDAPAEVWRGLMYAYLARRLPDGRQLLLILDGADESADWEPGPDLFPTRPAPGLRIVVSARWLAGDADGRGWLARLGWDRGGVARAIDLPPLTPHGMADVLASMGVPLQGLARRAEILAELFRLTGGDPLLMQLYAAELWLRRGDAARLHVDDLARLQPGLKGFFDGWWAEQRRLWGARTPLAEPLTQAVLDVLACACGPLKEDELLALLPPGQAASHWALDEALGAVGRFVVGDGRGQGYAFSHPRLADWFLEQLRGARQQLAVERRFVDWGQQVLREVAEGRAAPQAIPDYVLRHLRLHLERCGSDAADFVALTGEAWLRAWERLDRGSYAGFVADLERVAAVAARRDDDDAAAGRPPALLATELRCALQRTSIHGLAADLPAPLLRALVRHEVWEPATALAQAARLPEPRRRLAALLALVVALPRTHRPLAVASAIAQLDALLRDGLAPDDAATLLDTLAAPSAADDTPADAAARAGAVAEVAAGLPPAQREALWWRLAGRFARPWTRSQALGAEAPAWAAALRAAGMPAEALPADGGRAQARAAMGLPAQLGASRWRPAALLRLLRRTVGGGAGDWLGDTTLAEALADVHTLFADEVARSAARRDAAVDWLAGGALPEFDAAQAIAALAPCCSDEAALAALAARAAGLAAPGPRVQALLAIAASTGPAAAAAAQALLAQATADDAPPIAADDALALAERLATMLPPRALAAAWLALAARQPPAARAALLVGGQAWLFDDEHGLPPGRARALLDETLAHGVPPALAQAAWRLVQEPPGAVDAFALGLEAAGAGERLLLRGLQRCIVLGAGAAGTGAAPARRHRADGTAPAAERVAEHVAELDALLDAPEPPPLLDALERLAAADTQLPPHLADELFDRLLDRAPPAPPLDADTVPRLAAAVGTLAHRLLRERVPAFARLLAARVAADAAVLVAPTPAGAALIDAPMPDALRAPLLLALLDTPQAEAALRRAPRLTQPGDTLVARLLASPAMTQPGGTLAVELLPHLQPALLPRWLAAVAALDAGASAQADRMDAAADEAADDADPVDAALDALARARVHLGAQGVLPWAEVLDALRPLPDEDARARLLVRLLPRLDAAALPAATALAHELLRPSARALALAAVARRLPPERGGALLAEALAALADGSAPPRTVVALVTLAAGQEGGPPALHEAALQAALALPERAARAVAVGRLADTLPPARLAALAGSFTRLDDLGPRLPALLRLAAALDAPALRSRWLQRLAALARTLAEPAARSAALLAVAAAERPQDRLPLLDEALAAAALPRAWLSPRSLDTLPALLAGTAAGAPTLARAVAALEASPLVSAVEQAAAWLPWLHDAAIRRLVQATVARGQALPTAYAPYLDAELQRRVLREAGGNTALLYALAPFLGPAQRAAAQSAAARVADRRERLRLRAALAALHDDGHATGPWLEILRSFVGLGSDPTELAAIGDALRQVPPVHVPLVLAWLQQTASAPHRAAALAAVGPAVSPAAAPLAWSLAAALPTPALRAHATARLAGLAPPALRARALRLARAIDDEADRAAVLLRLAADTPDDDDERDTLHEAVHAAAGAIAEPARRAAVLLALLAAAPGWRHEVLQAIDTLPDAVVRADALVAAAQALGGAGGAAVVGRLAAALPADRLEPALLRLARDGGAALCAAVLDAAAVLPTAMARARVLAAAAPSLADAAAPRAQRLLDGLDVDGAWLHARVALAGCAALPLDDAQAHRVAAALPAMGGDAAAQAAALGALVPAWPAARLDTLLAAAAALDDPLATAELLSDAAARAEPGWAPALADAARAVPDAHARTVLLGQLALAGGATDEALWAEALRQLPRVGSARARAWSLVDIALRAGRTTAPLLARLRQAAAADPLLDAAALRRLAPVMPAEAARAALRQLPQGLADLDLAALLLALAAALPPADGGAVLACLPLLRGERSRSAALVELAPRLPDDAVPEALAMAAAMHDETFRVDAVCGLAPRLAPAQQPEAVAAVAGVRGDWLRVEGLLRLKPWLAGEGRAAWDAAATAQRAEACRARLAAADGETGEAAGAGAGAALHVASADYGLPAETADGAAATAARLIDEALAALPPTDDERPPQGPPPARPRPPALALRAAARLEADTDRHDALRRLLPQLGDAELGAALDIAASLRDPARRGDALARLAPRLQGALLERALGLAFGLPGAARAAALDALAPRCGAAQGALLLGQVRVLAGDGARPSRAALLRRLGSAAGVLAQLGGDALLDAVLQAADEAAGRWP